MSRSRDGLSPCKGGKTETGEGCRKVRIGVTDCPVRAPAKPKVMAKESYKDG